MQKILLIFSFVLFSFLSISVSAKQTSLTFNLIGRNLTNGVGKEMDGLILKRKLESFGHKVKLVDYEQSRKVNSADINIFIEACYSHLFSKAKFNWFIPNPEYCGTPVQYLQKFDLILCRTEEALRIFKAFTTKTYYLGFTSIDHYQLAESKDFSKHLHVGGESAMKGTDELLQAWRTDGSLPHLTLMKYRYLNDKKGSSKNLKLITKRVPEETLLTLQNTCGVHICPSKTEGFGHYLMEAMSTGAVVVTTDGPPMNEFIRDHRCLVKYNHIDKQRYATTYTIDQQDLINTVKSLQMLSEEELQMIGQQNRAEFLRRQAEFKKNFEILMEKAVELF